MCWICVVCSASREIEYPKIFGRPPSQQVGNVFCLFGACRLTCLPPLFRFRSIHSPLRRVGRMRRPSFFWNFALFDNSHNTNKRMTQKIGASASRFWALHLSKRPLLLLNNSRGRGWQTIQLETTRMRAKKGPSFHSIQPSITSKVERKRKKQCLKLWSAHKKYFI